VFSANAQYLAFLTTGIYFGEPTRIELWQVPSTRQVATWDVAASATLVSFSDDGRYLTFEVDEESSMTSIVEVGTGVILRQARRLSRSSVAWPARGSTSSSPDRSPTSFVSTTRLPIAMSPASPKARQSCRRRSAAMGDWSPQ